ncbi:MAG: DUF4836 family protein [Saprospiraceae bacterium]|nr:DUF4836 family protein [Saprospiraceae bacterium]
MKRILLLASLIGLITFASCKKDLTVDSKDSLAIIPATTGMLVAFNLPSLMEKADFDYIKTLDFYQEVMEEAAGENKKLAGILSDPASSGVDITQKMYLAVNMDSENSEDVFGGFVLSLNNPTVFEEMVAASGEGMKIETGSGFKYALGDSKSIIAWNDQFAIIGGTNSYLDLEKEVTSFFNTTPETSIAQDKDLQKALSDVHDISLWMTSNPFADDPNATFALSMAEIDPAALKDNFVHGYLDFNNGEIISSSDLYLQKGLTKDLDKIFDDEVNTDYGAYVPKENLLFAFTTAIDVQGIDEILTARPQSKSFLDYSLKQYGLTFTDIANTFGGDILVTGVSPKGAGKPAGLFAMNIKDDTKLMDFINLALENDILVADGKNVYKLNNELGINGMTNQVDLEVSFPDGSPRLVIQDDKIFITGSTELFGMIQNGGYANADQAGDDIPNLLSKHIFGGFFALKAIQQYDENIEKIFFEQMAVKIDRKHGDMNLELADKSTNALRQLFEMANEGYMNRNREAMSEPEAL